MIVKMVGLGCGGYWSDGWNQLDGTIVSMSIVEMVLTAVAAGSGVNMSFLRTLRMLRLVRVLRLMKSWKELYKIITTFGKALPQLANCKSKLFIHIAPLFLRVFPREASEKESTIENRRSNRFLPSLPWEDLFSIQPDFETAIFKISAESIHGFLILAYV